MSARLSHRRSRTRGHIWAGRAAHSRAAHSLTTLEHVVLRHMRKKTRYETHSALSNTLLHNFTSQSVCLRVTKTSGIHFGQIVQKLTNTSGFTSLPSSLSPMEGLCFVAAEANASDYVLIEQCGLEMQVEGIQVFAHCFHDINPCRDARVAGEWLLFLRSIT